MAGSGTYLRYVALGDSQTAGVGDCDDAKGLRGFVDRLAERLAAANPDVRYANLAVRGRLDQEPAGPELRLEVTPSNAWRAKAMEWRRSAVA